jgi:hypothetical protein
MALPNITSHIIATGASVQCRVSENGDTPDTILGLCTNVSYQEDFQLQDANVIGVLGPVSIDPQGYNLSVSVGVFVPAKKRIGNDTYQSDITKGVLEMLPVRADLFATSKGKVFQSMDFYDKDSRTVLAKFVGCVLQNTGMNIEGQTYAKANVQFRAIDRTV